MRKLFYFLVILLVLYGCRVINNLQPVNLPAFSEFEKKETFFYGLETPANVSIDIDVCETFFEFKSYDGNNIRVDVAYNENEYRNTVDFISRLGMIRILRQGEKNCGTIASIKAYVIISLPKSINEIIIDVNSYASKATFADLNAEKISYRHINGDIIINNSLVNNIDIDIANGYITYRDLNTTSLDVTLSNGDIVGENINTLTQKGTFSMTTTNGDIVLNEVYPLVVTLSTTNGDIRYHNLNKDKTISHTITVINGEKAIDI